MIIRVASACSSCDRFLSFDGLLETVVPDGKGQEQRRLENLIFIIHVVSNLPVC